MFQVALKTILGPPLRRTALQLNFTNWVSSSNRFQKLCWSESSGEKAKRVGICRKPLSSKLALQLHIKLPHTRYVHMRFESGNTDLIVATLIYSTVSITSSKSLIFENRIVPERNFINQNWPISYKSFTISYRYAAYFFNCRLNAIALFKFHCISSMHFLTLHSRGQGKQLIVACTIKNS